MAGKKPPRDATPFLPERLSLPALREGLVVALLDGGETRIFGQARQFHGLEQQRRFLKGEEHEHHRSNKENEELHRHLGHRVQQQAQAALADGFSGEIALYLALIGAEISQHEECAADQAAQTR